MRHGFLTSGRSVAAIVAGTLVLVAAAALAATGPRPQGGGKVSELIGLDGLDPWRRGDAGA